jgi:hypothetical protein
MTAAHLRLGRPGLAGIITALTDACGLFFFPGLAALPSTFLL